MKFSIEVILCVSKKLFHLLLITCLSVSVAFMTGCTQEYEVEVQANLEEAGEVEPKEDVFGKIKFPKTAKFLSSIPFPNLPINVRVF